MCYTCVSHTGEIIPRRRALQSVIFLFFLRGNGLMEQYGLCKATVPARRFLYYVPYCLQKKQMIHGFIMILITVACTFILTKTLPNDRKENGNEAA